MNKEKFWEALQAPIRRDYWNTEEFGLELEKWFGYSNLREAEHHHTFNSIIKRFPNLPSYIDRINIENEQRAEQRRRDYDTWTRKNVTLVEVDMLAGGKDSHPDIKTDSTQYLALIGGGFVAGTFSKVNEKGRLNFWGGYNQQYDKPGYNSSDWQKLWEIVTK